MLYGKNYWISTHFKASWDQANNICHSRGMEFLSLETLEEANQFFKLCEENASLFDKFTHIGALTTVAKSKTDWYWVNSGQKINYVLNFLPNQPDNANNNEMCLSIGMPPKNYSFNDIPCSGTQYKFICQSRIH